MQRPFSVAIPFEIFQIYLAICTCIVYNKNDVHENLQPIRPKLFCACFYKPGKIPGVSYITQGGISIHEIPCKEIRLSPSYAASCILFIVLCLFRHTRRCGKIAAWNGGDAGAD